MNDKSVIDNRWQALHRFTAARIARPAGLRYEKVVFKLHYLLSESRRRQLSGVAPKDETRDGQLTLNERTLCL